MNPFQSFQPSKQKSIGGLSKETAAAVASITVKPKISALKALLLTLDDDPLNPKVAIELNNADATGDGDKELAPVRSCTVRRIDTVPVSHMLYRQINIEANFDLTPLLQSNNMLAAEKQLIEPVTTYIYPFNARLNDRYELADFIAQNISKPRHWAAQECDLPILSASAQSIGLSSAAGGSTLMLGGAASTATSVNGNIEHEAALGALQSRLLKWQNALHHLLENLYARDGGVGNAEHDPAFYILGRSLAVPVQTSNKAARNIGNTMALPYTSALFYRAPSIAAVVEANASNTRCKVSASAAVTEPVCMLVGVHKGMLSRLQQLGAQCYLIQDPTQPWNNSGSASSTATAAQGARSGNGSNAEISLSASSKGALDPHASTSALLNSKKLGVNILLRGRYAVSIAAQVLLEIVFAFVRDAGRGVSNDVPILLTQHSFPHSLPLRWDKCPVQCQHKFASSSSKTAKDDAGSVNLNIVSTDPSTQPVHKVHLQGIGSSDCLHKLLTSLQSLACPAKSQPPAQSSGHVRHNRAVGKISAAYKYLQQADLPDSTSDRTKNAARLDSLPMQPLLASARSAPVVPVKNPMLLVTSTSRSYSDAPISNGGEEDIKTEDGAPDAHIPAEAGVTAGTGHADASATLGMHTAGDNVSQKRKLGEISVTTAAAPTAPAVQVPNTVQPSHLRTEDWLKQRRISDTPYCLIQLTLLTPRMAQVAYAQCQKNALIAAGTVDPANQDECILPAHEWLEELRWCASAYSQELVEVVSTTQPALRAGLLPPQASSTWGSLVGASNGDSFEHLDEMDENGTIVLDALNKYSIYVENKSM